MQSRSTSEVSSSRKSSHRNLSSDHPVEDEEEYEKTRESQENDGDSEELSSMDDDPPMTNIMDDVESMDEDSVDETDSLSYQQDEAMKKLSNVFKLLNLEPIHDR